MDAEFLTIIGGGVVFIVAALGFLVLQRRKNAPAGAKKDAPAKGPRARPPAPKEKEKPTKKGAEVPEKRGLLASISSLRVGDAAETPAPKGETGASKHDLAALESLIAADHLDEAARLAMRLTLWDKAAQLYLKAGQPGNAAHCAKRAEKFEMAAELYEKAGDVESAVRMWERAGNKDRARKLAGTRDDRPTGDDERVIQIGKQLQKEIDAAIEKKDHMRAAELFEQAGDKENAAEQFATFAKTARRPEVYADRIQALSPRVAYNMLRIAQKGRKMGPDSAELYRRLALLQHHFGNVDAAITTLKQLLAAVPTDEEARQMLVEMDERRDAPSEPAPAPLDHGAAGGAELDLELEAAKAGPGIAELVALIGGSECDLGNIEVFYRLGLACLAANKRADAKRAFQAVDDVSPGYRDTERRLQELR